MNLKKSGCDNRIRNFKFCNYFNSINSSQLHLQELEKRKAIEEALLEKERQKQEKIEKEKKRIADKEARMAQMKIDFINEMNAKASKQPLDNIK